MRRIALLLLSASCVFAQGVEYVKANYTKYEVRIAMRDGKKLFTSIYVPKDDSEKWPIMFDRTPVQRGSLRDRQLPLRFSGPTTSSRKRSSFSFIRMCAAGI